MFQAITFSRIVQVYVVFLVGGIFFLYLAFKILRRGKKNINLVISAFFISNFLGAIFNVIYASITTISDEPTVVALHFITYFLFSFAQIFLLIYNLIILKSEQIITEKRQLCIMGIFGCLLLGLIFIPGGIRINESTHYRPQWNLPFFLYANIICISIAIIPTIYTSILIYKKFDDRELKKRWIFYFIGIIMIYIEWFGVGVMILINDPELRALWNIYDLTVFISVYFIYYGVGRQL